MVVYDASVLYPSTLRDLLIRLAQSGLVSAKWTDRILDEVFLSLRKNRPDLEPERLNRTRSLMVRAVRDCMVKGWEPLVDVVDLPDPDDRHVVAAAVRARAQLIVTSNVRDFPAGQLSRWDIEPRSPDDFVLDQIDLSGNTVYAAV
ncbi:MAG TPA: PIN domain-containing protein, partial [Mycobacteriales bacterium]